MIEAIIKLESEIFEMKKKNFYLFILTLFILGGMSFTQPANAAIVDSSNISDIDLSDIYAFPDPAPTGSGLGKLDVILFEHGGSAENTKKVDSVWHDYDDANIEMPGGIITEANESYVTSIGDIRDFYNTWFGTTDPIDEIVLFLNVTETGGSSDISLGKLDIIVDYTTPALNPAGNDISSDDQNAINDGFDGGTRIARLGSGAPFSLAQLNPGIGIPDYFILTGIDPFNSDYNPATKILFHWESSGHDSAGGEVVYLSGDFRKEDLINGVVPEPATLSLLGLGLLGLLRLRTKKRR